jgi:hypothetical protein
VASGFLLQHSRFLVCTDSLEALQAFKLRHIHMALHVTAQSTFSHLVLIIFSV